MPTHPEARERRVAVVPSVHGPRKRLGCYGSRESIFSPPMDGWKGVDVYMGAFRPTIHFGIRIAIGARVGILCSGVYAIAYGL